MVHSIFERLPVQSPDEIIGLMTKFQNDPRETKVDLGVGVYRNARGHTPIMQAVKQAEQLLWSRETTKSYTALPGDAGFRIAMIELVLGNAVPGNRVASAATPGGTGAVRNGLELAKLANPNLTIWVSAPTWPNHLSIIEYLDIPHKSYRYFDAAHRTVDIEGMLDDLKQAKPGDVVLLHGCCHNPTGANLRETDWRALADLLIECGLVPFIDIAYQGFGDGLEADAFGTRQLAKTVPEMIIAASCSKNFGVYRERAGCLITVSDEQAHMQATLTSLNRLNYSFPPDHGTRLVEMVLTDPALRTSWLSELEGIRTGLITLREGLAQALQERTGSDSFGFLAEHRGMFSLLGLNPDQIDIMRSRHGVYAVSDSRINVAGLSEASIPLVADAIADVITPTS
ncbi:MAG: amino acid aminotransferase [Litoreibacter sp.]